MDKKQAGVIADALLAPEVEAQQRKRRAMAPFVARVRYGVWLVAFGLFIGFLVAGVTHQQLMPGGACGAITGAVVSWLVAWRRSRRRAS
jgi:nitrate reductase gamma subunit